jgi:PDZ domain
MQMKKLSGRYGLRALFAGAGMLALLAVATPTAAQSTSDDCRCVDRDGNEIERCSCLRAPGVETLMADFGRMAGRPRLGISVTTGQEAARDAEGVLVTDVMADGPAYDAGIREGDVITRLDGVTLTESIGAEDEEDFDLDRSAPVQRLLSIAREFEPGQEVDVEYLRDGERQTTVLQAADLSDRWGSNFSLMGRADAARELGERLRVLTGGAGVWESLEDMPGLDGDIRLRLGSGPDELRLFGRSAAPMLWSGALYRDGLELAEVNPALGAYFGAEEGVLITSVDRSSGLGLEAGDVVLRVGDRATTTPDRFRRILASYGDNEDINLHILRDGAEMTVTGRLRY